MYANSYNTPTTTIPYEKKHLLDRLERIENDKNRDLPDAFHLNPTYPKTYGELKQFLADGKISVDSGDYKDEAPLYDSWYSFFEVANPEYDRDGYDKARDAMIEAKRVAKDTIMVKTPEDGLAALQAFQAQTFH